MTEPTWMHRLFDQNAAPRLATEWRPLLAESVESLSQFLGHEFRATSWFLQDDPADYASTCNCVDIVASLSEALDVVACGVLCVTINFGETVSVCCDLLLFSHGRRLVGPGRSALIHMTCNPGGWESPVWVNDEYGEWEAHQDFARWCEV